jgi:exopolysaccharide biosynthesis polyprenyl glycosylphosphotransferase
MGQLTNILDGRIVPASIVAPPAHLPQPSNLARLIPGAENSFQQKLGKQSRVWFDRDDFTSVGASLLTSLFLSACLHCLHVDVFQLPLLLALVLSSVLVVFGRKTLRVLFVERSDRRNVLAVGSGPLAMNTLAEIRGPYGSRRSVTRVMSDAEFRRLCACGEFATFAREQFLDEVLVVSRDVDLLSVMAEARLQRLDVSFALAGLADRESGNLTVEHIGRARLISIHRERAPIVQLSAKRAADIVLSALALVALLPLLSLIAAMIAIDSAGPVLYRSQRVGRKGNKFRCYKFRTMVANADAGKEQLRKSNERTGAFFKITGDPRVTQIGKLLRRYSLDELPQLWNVLRGDMSLVGPRPHPPDDLARYSTHHLQRLDFVPGITGLWQVTARQDPSFEKSVALDVEYIRNWNLWLDLQILWRTVGAVVRGRGV